MAFESLSSKLQATIKRLKGQTRVTEKDVKEFMREIRLALLEADVNYKVVKDFVARVSEKAVGQEVLESLSPGQQIVKIVDDELTELLGAEDYKLDLSKTPPNVIMMVGLQGTGKTTASAKLAAHLRKQGRKPLMVACDIYRPAAIQQLQVLGKQIDIPVFAEGIDVKAATIAKNSIKYAIRNMHDVVIIDTAGRLQIDEALMQELKDLKSGVKPHEILLVVDSMTGQDAVNIADTFNKELGIDGIVLTKLDGDTRGGAALSVKAVTGKPIKFCGIGEKMGDIEPFHPDRMASRILGMGDMLSLIEKAEKAYDEKKAAEMEEKLKSNKFTLQDFYDQMVQMKSMGSMQDILAQMPGGANLKGVKVDEKAMARTEAIILSMTPYEREHPNVIAASRKKRIAAGSGTRVEDVNRLLKSYEQMQKMIKQLSGPGMGKKLKRMSRSFGGFKGGFPGF